MVFCTSIKPRTCDRRKLPKRKKRSRKWRAKGKRSLATPRRPPFKLRGIFFGSSGFAVPALRAFARAVDCRLVVTQPDRPAGRGHKLTATAVQAAAQELGIASLQPERLGSAASALASIEAHLFAVASYGKIIPQALLDLPRIGALNVHPSLLPLYRGATPLQSQLRDGVTESGVTVILMDAGMDTGDIVLQERSAIRTDETYGALHDRFAELGATLLSTACALAAEGNLQRSAQAGLAPVDIVARTLTRPLKKEDLWLDWSWPGARIVNHVRAFAPQPGARARLDGESQGVKILQARATDRAEPGELAVACSGGYVIVERLVPANRKAMSGATYVAEANRNVASR